MRPNKTEDGLVHLILCSHKVLREMLCNVLVYICKDLVFFIVFFFVKKKTPSTGQMWFLRFWGVWTFRN